MNQIRTFLLCVFCLRLKCGLVNHSSVVFCIFEHCDSQMLIVINRQPFTATNMNTEINRVANVRSVASRCTDFFNVLYEKELRFAIHSRMPNFVSIPRFRHRGRYTNVSAFASINIFELVSCTLL